MFWINFNENFNIYLELAWAVCYSNYQIEPALKCIKHCVFAIRPQL